MPAIAEAAPSNVGTTALIALTAGKPHELEALTRLACVQARLPTRKSPDPAEDLLAGSWLVEYLGSAGYSRAVTIRATSSSRHLPVPGSGVGAGGGERVSYVANSTSSSFGGGRMADQRQEHVDWPSVPPNEASWVLRLFSSSRYFAGFAVLGAFLAAVTLFVYGTLVVIQQIWTAITEHAISGDGAKHLQVVFIEMTDVFLLGTVLFIVAFGRYQLFIQPELPVPPWLKIQQLDQLTARLVEVVGVLLSVTFLAFAVEGTAGANFLEFGASVAIVIGALSLLLMVSRRIGHSASPEK